MNLISQIQIFEAKLQNLIERYYDICLSEDYYTDQREISDNGQKDISGIDKEKSGERDDSFDYHYDKDLNDKNVRNRTINIQKESDNKKNDQKNNVENNMLHTNQMKISHLSSFLLKRIERNNDAHSIDSDLFIIR